MKRVQEKLNHISIVISIIAAFMAFLALVISFAAFVKSCKKSRVTTTEYDNCNFDDDTDEDWASDTLAF
ncbi:MAG: hypothetical protein K2G04_09455 [Oscillospiraceae bacterium]|nr:hypothetical protein [Oscillospiraceae bacterium]